MHGRRSSSSTSLHLSVLVPRSLTPTSTARSSAGDRGGRGRPPQASSGSSRLPRRLGGPFSISSRPRRSLCMLWCMRSRRKDSAVELIRGGRLRCPRLRLRLMVAEHVRVDQVGPARRGSIFHVPSGVFDPHGEPLVSPSLGRDRAVPVAVPSCMSFSSPAALCSPSLSFLLSP
jgi:hypothetical protein